LPKNLLLAIVGTLRKESIPPQPIRSPVTPKFYCYMNRVCLNSLPCAAYDLSPLYTTTFNGQALCLSPCKKTTCLNLDLSGNERRVVSLWCSSRAFFSSVSTLDSILWFRGPSKLWQALRSLSFPSGVFRLRHY